jgi:hypothetical protein
LNRTQADFEREFAAVFAETVKLQARPHRPELGTAHETRAVAAVFSAKAFGNQEFNGLANQIGAIVAEELFGLGVHYDDAAFLANNHNAIRGRFDEGPVNGVAYGK